MAIAIRILCDPSSVPDRAEVEGVFDDKERVLPEQEMSFRHVQGDEGMGMPEHYRATYRFDDGEDRDAIEAEFSENIFAGISWYSISAHDCTHDKGGGPCPGWTTLRSRGAVPDQFSN